MTLVDLLAIVGIAAAAVLVALPRRAVEEMVQREDEVIRDLDRLHGELEAHRGSAATDRDRDGVGEYPPLAEILDRGGDEGRTSRGYRRVEGTDVWETDGYYLTLLLPDVERRPARATDERIVIDYAEVAYVLVAWPVGPGRTGMRAYARLRDGLLQHGIDGFPYGGADDPPMPRHPLVEGPREAPRPAARPEDDREWAPPAFDVR